ncbi:MAG: hypothetical protein QOG53_1839 [Frankiales bacterium]|nr:hypothetical protein [Frankiales bacterium]
MATRKQERLRDAQRRQRVNEMRRQQEKAERRRRAIRVGIIGVVALAIVGSLVFFGIKAANKDSKPAIAGVQTFGDLSRKHTQGPVTYAQVPPVGGDHNPVPLNCGIYTSPVPNENAVHSLEHGAVWITYQPDLPTADVQTLTSLVRGKTYVILSPYPGLPSKVVASAWSTQLKLDSATDPRLTQFIDMYRAGPQAPERGGACAGTGTPVS